ncbi:MAG: cyclic nucleotide-binding domain-containing protein, partial [Spirochaetia bacterium]
MTVSSRRYNPVSLPNIEFDSCTPDLRKKLLHESPLFRELDSVAIEEINTHFADHGYAARETIIQEGAPAERFFIVALGIVKLFRYTESGDSVLLDVLGQGDHFGSPAGFGPNHYRETA